MAHNENITPLGGSEPAPFNDLPKLPPAIPVETISTLKSAIRANKALAELKTAGDLIPNQTILIRAILLQEAKLSSEIENIFTTNDELYRAFEMEPQHASLATKEVLRYQEALWHGYQRLNEGHRLSSSLFVELVKILMQTDDGIRKAPGIRIVNRKTKTVIYAPPEGEFLITELLDNLAVFLANSADGLDPLIKLAIAHYQFEAIHPFPDGNGRTGRVINILYLVDQKLLELPVLFLSSYILRNKSAYYEGLRRVTEKGDWEDWIVYMLDGISETAIETRSKIFQIRKAIEAAATHARVEMQRGYSSELLELVFSQPYTRIGSLVQRGIAKRETASSYLKELERVGILRAHKIGREVLYLNPTLIALLTT